MDTCLLNSQKGDPFIQEIADQVGKLYNMPTITVVESSTDNACATTKRFLFQNKLYIAYNPEFINQIYQMGYWALVALIAHEIGHLYYRHTGSTKDRELQVDKFAGRAVNWMNGDYWQGVHLFEHPKFEFGYGTHPDRPERKIAFTEGWNAAAAGIPFECYKKEEPNPMAQVVGTVAVGILFVGLISLLAGE